MKWIFRLILGAVLIGVLFDVGYTLTHFRDLRTHPPLEHEFTAVSVGATKDQVRELFQKKEPGYLDESLFEKDIWSFSGPWSCYTVAFDPVSHRVSTKRKDYPPSCIVDVEPRGLIVRWLWEKWDQMH
jgi:hypothetical protein